jgi:four helix bundle protein
MGFWKADIYDDTGCRRQDAGCSSVRMKLIETGNYMDCRIRDQKDMGYKTLDIWKLSRELVIDIHLMTLQKLPKFEAFEEGGQIRRSIKSVKSTIVEGYGRRRYKYEFIRYLAYAAGSCDETRDHLETLFETGSLQDADLYRNLHARMDILGRKIYAFTISVEKAHRSVK